ncbi:hypothetical protein [Fulvivirga sp.]|uniref:hypothetical protein n=1 Tax=Fulvivirga sp. TaxID=1931237 RepID=UPI0032ED91E7
MRYCFFLCGFFLVNVAFGQVKQTHIYELEKKNTDDFFTVLPAGEKGVVIFRDTDDYKKGDKWQVVALDTTLVEKWNIELSIDTRYVFKGYELKNSTVYFLFRRGEMEKNDYHLITISIDNGEVERYDIKNEIALTLSHLEMLSDRMILAGYVNFSPTLVTYAMGGESFEVVPGFFKDRSTIVDLRSNENGTFNSVTLEKDYAANYIKLRTYSDDGELLFEREVESDDKHFVLSAKSSGFIDGNFAIAGTYSFRRSYYAAGIYLAIVKPKGQDNIIKYHSFADLDHFFDYMKPKRAARVKARLKRRSERGKELNYTSKLLLHEVRKSKNGYLLAAEIYDPEYIERNQGTYYGGVGFDNQSIRNRSRAAQSYAKQPSRLQNVEDADHFKYLESIVVEINKEGDIVWDNSMKIEDVETNSLEQVVQLTQSGDLVNMLYKAEEEIKYQSIQQEEIVEVNKEPLKLPNEYDKINHTYDGSGRSEYWFGNNFIVWGYHKVENKVETESRNRNVLFINKVVFK